MGRSRIFFVTDLHGSEQCYRKFLNAAKAYEANILILGGDITGKMVVSIVEDQGRWSTNYMGEHTEVTSREETLKLETAIRNSGYYPYLTTKQEVDSLNSSPDKVEICS